MDIQPKSKPVSVDAPALPFSPQSAALSLISSSPIIPNSTRATVASVSGFASPVRRSTGFQTAKSPSVVVSPSKVADVPHINLSVSADMALSALAFSAPVTVQSLSIDAPIYAVTPPLPSLPSETVSHPTLPVVPADDNPDNRLAALLDRIAIGKPKANEKPLSTDTKTSMFSAFLDRLSGEKSGSSVESVSVSESAQQMVHSVHVEARAAVAAPVPGSCPFLCLLNFQNYFVFFFSLIHVISFCPHCFSLMLCVSIEHFPHFLSTFFRFSTVRASSASFIDSTPGTGHLSPQLIDVPVRQTPSPGGLGFDSTEQMKRAGLYIYLFKYRIKLNVFFFFFFFSFFLFFKFFFFFFFFFYYFFLILFFLC
jgi:hypothetical protein